MDDLRSDVHEVPSNRYLGAEGSLARQAEGSISSQCIACRGAWLLNFAKGGAGAAGKAARHGIKDTGAEQMFAHMLMQAFFIGIIIGLSRWPFALCLARHLKIEQCALCLINAGRGRARWLPYLTIGHRFWTVSYTHLTLPTNREV